MSARAKENKVACAIKNIFKTPEKNRETANGANGTTSPARRLVRRPSPQSAPTVSRQSKVVPAKNVPPVDYCVRARRLLKEFKEMQKLQKSTPNPNFTVELVNDNLYEWNVKLLRVDPESQMAKDMKELGIPHILLNLIFPDNFPFAPPFMRVVEPRIEKGFVMDGGAICMELLTQRGWASAYTCEALIMQFSASLVKGQGRIAKSVRAGSKEFSRTTAMASFRNLVKTHEKYGWVTPSLADG